MPKATTSTKRAAFEAWVRTRERFPIRRASGDYKDQWVSGAWAAVRSIEEGKLNVNTICTIEDKGRTDTASSLTSELVRASLALEGEGSTERGIGAVVALAKALDKHMQEG